MRWTVSRIPKRKKGGREKSHWIDVMEEKDTTKQSRTDVTGKDWDEE